MRKGGRSGAAAYLAGADLRRRWVQVIALAVFGGLAMGVSLAFLAGARRTASAYDRHLDASRASHVEINPGQYQAESDEAIRRLPGVEDISMWAALTLVRVDEDGEPVPVGQDALTFVSDGDRFYDMDRLVVTEGRLPAANRADEAVVSDVAVKELGLGVGDTIAYRWYHYDEATGAPVGDDAPPVRVRVVGVMISNEDIVPEPLDKIPRVMLSPAMLRVAGELERIDYPWYGLRLEDGYGGVAAADRAWRQIARDHNEAVDADEYSAWSTNIHLTTDLQDRSERAVRPLVIALAVFGGLSLIASVAFVTVAAARVARRPEADLQVTRMLGLDRRDIVLAGLAVPLAGVFGAAVVAALVGIGLSPVFPIGPFRAIEPTEGISLDLAVIGLGAAALLLAGGSVAALSLRRAATAPSAAGVLHPSRTASWLTRTRLPLPMVLGARQALEPGRGRTAVPTRSTLVALAGAVLVLVTAVVFAGNLRDLESDTSRFGWNADAVAISGSGYDAFIPDRAGPWLREHGVDAIRYATTGRVVVDDSGVAAVSLADGPSHLGPTIVEGLPPAGSGQIALGTETMDDLGLEQGDRVELGSSGRSIAATVTGRAVFPLLGGVQTVHTALGQGAWLSGADARLIDDLPEDGSIFNFALLDLHSGTDAGALQEAIRRTDDLSPEGGNDVLGVLRPPEVATAVSLDTGQVALAGVLVVVAVLVLALTLTAVVHRRARDLAVHRVLGFTSGQVGAAMSWQSLLTVAVGILVGLPLGVAAGRWIWKVFADQIHVVPDPTVPVVALATVVVVLVLTSLAVSVRPGLQAARTSPVRWLRAE